MPDRHLHATANFSNAKPAMWQQKVTSDSLQYSVEDFRSRAREYAIDFDLPPLPGSGFTAKITVTVTSTSATRWNALLVDSGLASNGCGVDAGAFGLSGTNSTSQLTFEFTQPGFPYPDLYQSGSHIRLIVNQVASTSGEVSNLPASADLHVVYTH